MKYLREKTASVNVLPGKGSRHRDRTVLHTLFPHRRPLAQLRRDRRELWSQTGTPGKHQSRLKIPL